MSEEPFISSPGSNLHFSVERMGFQVSSSSFGNQALFETKNIEGQFLIKEQIHSQFNAKRKYIYVVKSNLRGSLAYAAKITSFKGKFFCSMEKIYDLRDENSFAQLAQEVVEENQKFRCAGIVIDGKVRVALGATLQKTGKIKKAGSSQGKFKFVQVSDVIESASLFEGLFTQNKIFFADNTQKFMLEYFPTIKRRKIRDGFSFISTAYDHEILEVFSLGVREMSKIP